MRCIFSITRVVFLLSLICLLGPGRGVSAEKVKFALDWIPIGKHAPFYAAIDKGFYKKAGLEVTITRGFGSRDTAKKIAAQAMDIGLADTPSHLLARAKGGTNKIVGIFADRGVNVVFALKRSGIRKPKDLSGRTIGDSVGGAGIAVFPAFAKLNGIKNWTFKPAAPAAKFGLLLSGKVDAILTASMAILPLRFIAKKQGKSIVSILYSDFGMDMYGHSIAARDDTIQQRRKMVRSFTQATMKSIAWSVENPRESVALLLKRFPTLKPRFARARWDFSVNDLVTPFARANGIGMVDRKKMEKTINIIKGAYKLKTGLTVDETYTNEFLPRLFPKSPKS